MLILVLLGILGIAKQANHDYFAQGFTNLSPECDGIFSLFYYIYRRIDEEFVLRLFNFVFMHVLLDLKFRFRTSLLRIRPPEMCLDPSNHFCTFNQILQGLEN